jgi:hypothetical protein
VSEHVFVMTSQGHPHAIFRRALERRNLAAAWAVAAELHQIGLGEAPTLCPLAADQQPPRFERAAARWIARYLEEEPRIELEELRLTADLLAGLRGRHAGVAARALRELFAGRRRADLIDALARFTSAR